MNQILTPDEAARQMAAAINSAAQSLPEAQREAFTLACCRWISGGIAEGMILGGHAMIDYYDINGCKLHPADGMELERQFVLASDYDALRSRLASLQLEFTHSTKTCAEQQRRAETAEARLDAAERLIRRAYGAIGALRRISATTGEREACASYDEWQREANSWLGTAGSAAKEGGE